MSKKLVSMVGTVAIAIAIIAIVHRSVAQETESSTTSSQNLPTPKYMFIHAYTKNYDDLEHCFVQDNSRTLYFDGYTDVAVKDSKQVEFYLYNLRNGTFTPISSSKAITVYGTLIHIEIKETTPPHLGPGPYMAMISILPSAAKRTTVNPSWYYYYGTWDKSSSPLDCWH